MKKRTSTSFARLGVTLLGAALGMCVTADIHAASITKTNNLDPLNLNSSWIGDVAPTASDVATWNSSSAGGAVSLGGSVSWQGIYVSSGTPSSVVITDPGATTLTLGSSGISLQDGGPSNRGMSIASPIILLANQAWILGSQSGANITASNVISGGFALDLQSAPANAGALNLIGANTFSGGFTNGADAIVTYSSAANLVASGGLLTSSPFGTGPLTINGGRLNAGGKAFFNPSVIINGDFTWATTARDDTSGNFDLGGRTNTITLTRSVTPTNAPISGGNNSIRFTAITGGTTSNTFYNGVLRFAADSTVAATNFVQVHFATVSSSSNIFVDNAGLIIGPRVYACYGTGSPFGAAATDKPAVTVEAGGYYSLADNTAARGHTIFSLDGAGTVVAAGSSASADGQLATLTINGGTKNASADFAGVIRDVDMTTFPWSDPTYVVGITKSGNTTQILSGTNTYSGPTTVSGGSLITTTLSSNGNYSVSSGAALGVRVGASATSLRITGLTNSTCSLLVDFNGFGLPSAPVIINSGNNAVNGDITVVLDKASLVTGTFTVITNASATRGTAKYKLASQPGVAATLSDKTNVVTVTVTAVTPITDFVWTGVNGSAWDINLTTNWQNDLVSALAYKETPTPRGVIFEDTAPGTTDVNLTTTVNPTNVLFENYTLDYSLTGLGKISGATGLTKDGIGTVSLATTNNYTGTTVVKAGTLVISNALALGGTSGGTVLSNASVLLLDGDITVSGESLSLGGTTGGVGGLSSQSGTSNNWTGPITLTGDLARLNNANPSGALRVGAIGNGSFFSEAVNVRRGTVIFAGNSTYQGRTVIANATGILDGANNRLPIGTELNLGYGVNDVGILDLNGWNQEVAGLQLYYVTNGLGGLGKDSTVTNTSGTVSTLTVNVGAKGTDYATSLTNGLWYGGQLGGNLAFVKTGTNSFTLAGNNTHTGATTVNQGTLYVDGDNGSSTVNVNAGGTLGGTGTIGGAVNVNASGTLAPGASIGTLTVSGPLTLNGASTTKVEINSDSTSSDLVTGLGTVNYGGTLVVNNLGATPVQTNQSFTLFSATTHNGSFSSISPSSPPATVGLVWSFTNGVLKAVIGSTAPVRTNITYTRLSSTQMKLDWPAGQGWRLETRTNTLAQGLTPTNWFAVTPTPTPPITNTIDPANGAVFYRLVWP